MRFMLWRFNISVIFCIEYFFHIWFHKDLEILAIVARAQYKRLCLRSNNSEVCEPWPFISGILVQNTHLCKKIALPNCGVAAP